MVNRNMLPEYGACQLLIAKKKKQFSESIFLPGKSKRWVHVAGCYERGRCEKGTKEREGLFQFFGEINEIISTLSWFVSCLMIRYLFKVGKDTSVVFFWSMYTSCTKFCDMLHILFSYIGIRPVSVCTSEMRARGEGKCLDRQQPLPSRATCFLYLLLTNICTKLSLSAFFKNIFIPQHYPKALAINHLP